MLRALFFGSVLAAVSGSHKSPAAEASWLGRPFVKIVDEATTVPGETHSFGSFNAPFEPRFTLRDGTVHLVAPAGTVNGSPARALLRHREGILETLVFTNTVSPDGTKFTDTFYPTDLQGGAINFTGASANGAKSALYELRDGTITRAIPTGEPLPGIPDTLLGFGGNTRRGSRVVGGGQILSGGAAVFMLEGAALTKIADGATDLPGPVTGFGGITGQGIFGFDGNKVVFGTISGGAAPVSGVFSYTVGGGFEKIADGTDFLPGDAGRFTGFAEADIEGEMIFFIGLNSSNQRRLLARSADGTMVVAANAAGAIGAAGPRSVYYANGAQVSRWTDGYVEAAVRAGETIDGRTIQSVFDVSGQGDDLAIGVHFSDGMSGVYRATGASPVSAPVFSQNLTPTRNALEGSNTRLTVAATGGALTYRWFKGEAEIPGAIDPFLAFPAVALTDAGLYKVVVSNSAGSETSVQLTLNVTAATAPAIMTQPASARVALGGTASLTVAATGSPLFYQWLFNGQPLANATTASLRISGAKESDLGEYRVVVHNAAGTVTSQAATLGIATPPTIIRAPAGGLISPGNSFSFSVAASGDAPFTYRWTKNNSTIPNATNASYTIPSATGADGASYAVVVTNPYGQAFSTAAMLVIDGPAAKMPIATFRSGQPALDNGRIVVPRDNNNSFGTLDLFENGSFRTLADTTMTASGAASPFKNFAAVEVDGADVAFTATLADNSSGLFLLNGGQTRRIADPSVMMPDTQRSLASIVSFALNGGQLVFDGADATGFGGVFLHDGAALRTLAARGGSAPGGRTFLNFGGVDIANGVVVFWASLDTGGGGIFAWKDNALTKVADYQSSTLPGLAPGFFGIPNQTPSTDGASVAFTTTRGADIGALWTIKLDGTAPIKIAEKGQSAPSGGQFNTFETLIMDGGDLVFGGRNQSFQSAIYFAKGGVTTRILAETDSINGMAGTLKFSKDGYSNGRLAVGRTQFEFQHDILIINVSAPAAPALLPEVTLEPQDLTLAAGQRAQFAVAGNSAGLAFQWSKNGEPIPGASAPELAIPGVKPADAGEYACVLTNSAGRVTSRAARLVVNAPSLPVSLSIGAGLNHLRLIEFVSAAGAVYRIQYAPGVDGPWQSALSPAGGTGARLQWIDSGPPETESHPSNAPMRLYRVISE